MDLLHHASNLYHSFNHIRHTLFEAHDEMVDTQFDKAVETVDRSLRGHGAGALADDGWSVALLGRTRTGLEGTAAGRDAMLVLPTDVSDEGQVQQLMQAADEKFGQIDVCVSCASVHSYGRFEDTPPDVFRQILETNLFGQVYASRAVLPYFRRR